METWSVERYHAFIRTGVDPGEGSPAVSAADAQPAAAHGRARAHPADQVHSRVRIHYHSRRRRLIDPDRLYSHAATDGLRRGGLLVDDSLRYVEAVTNSQEKARKEETIIEVWEVGEMIHHEGHEGHEVGKINSEPLTEKSGVT